jgi:hypothetical protein
MGKFDDLLSDDLPFLQKLVDAQNAGHSEGYLVIRMLAETRLLPSEGTGPADEIKLGRGAPVMLDALADADYLTMHVEKGTTIRPTPRAMDCVAHFRRRRLARKWEDLAFDLSNEGNLRGRVVWALATVVVANVGTIAMKLLGWL